MSDIGSKIVFSRNLQRLMNERGKDRKQMCSALGISYSTFSDWANGTKYPRIDKIELLANFFGVQKSELIEEHFDIPNNSVPIAGTIAILGSIRCGEPMFAEENIEGYVPTIRAHPEDYFALRAKGDSMIGAGITDGSIVVCHKQDYADDGDIVACGVNRDEATLKRFKCSGNAIILMPENSAYTPIVLSKQDFDDGSACIYGVAVEVTRTL